MEFVFEQIRTGGDRNLGYLVGARGPGVAFAVDPSFSPERFEERARAQRLTITRILNTHGHGDHTNGNAALKHLTGALVAAHPLLRPDLPLADGATLAVGPIAIHVMQVPGHSPDHLLFHLPAQKVALTGDLLFVGKIGGTGDDDAARTEYASLQRVMRSLPDETTVWPGHDYGCRPSSTIGLERANNPFLAVADVAAFLALKREWPDFKARHGLA